MRPVWPLVLLAACQSRTPSTADEVRRIAEDVIPRVERAVGLTFTEPPALDVRTREQVEHYLTRRLDEEYPPERLAHVAAVYQRFGLIPDTLDLRALLLAVLAEQVVGYFDPDSAKLYVVEGSGAVEIRLVLAHELVHALQHQYVPLDSLLSPSRSNDATMAAQAVFEGQATIAAFAAILDPAQLQQMDQALGGIRDALRDQQEQMPLFSSAPLIVQEWLLFPYLAGADFMRWFERAHPDTQPYGSRLPRSTEQILHPEKYQAGDDPTPLAFAQRGDTALHQDGFGEFEIRIMLQQLTGSESLASAGARGWDGDVYAIYPGPRGTEPIVWWSVWDTPAAANNIAALLRRHWPTRGQSGTRWTIERTDLGGMAAVRLVDAPDDWAGWTGLPTPIR